VTGAALLAAEGVQTYYGKSHVLRRVVRGAARRHQRRTAMFDVDRFIADCRAALTEQTPEVAIKELLERAVAQPGEVEAALAPRPRVSSSRFTIPLS
jgi:hypothetical protein